MRSITFPLKYFIFILLCAMLIVSPGTTSAQQPPTITATAKLNDVDCSNEACSFTITFPPAGGAVTGQGTWRGEIEGTEIVGTLTMTGTFAGGDGGEVSGTWRSVLGDTTDGITWTGSWNGNFYANGTGSGILDTETVYAPNVSSKVMESKIADDTWQATFSAAEFQAALEPSGSATDSPDAAATAAPDDSLSEPVTSESIYNTYGITVEDTFSEDPNVSKSWSEQELTLLNDVLKELPPRLRKKLAVTRIVRSVRDPDHPKWVGGYYPCDGRTGHEPCTVATAAIRIYDGALQPFDFTDDPNGYKEFKGTILHEITHALQSYQDEGETGFAPQKELLNSPYSSALVQNYMDATRPVTNMGDPAFWGNNGWDLVAGQWKLTAAPGNQTPTNYAKTNPAEDLCESVMLYVYEPQKLQNSSMKRYEFIRDNIFGGVEYENGIQK